MVDWNEIKRSLDGVKCIKREHPLCEFHYTEKQAFKKLSKDIHYCKVTIGILGDYRKATRPATVACEKHWIVACYECSPIMMIDRLLKKAKKELASLKFRLINLPTVAKMLGRTPVASVTLTERPAETPQFGTLMQGAPTERLFLPPRTSDRPTYDDMNDNIHLIEAWLSGRKREIKVSK